MGETKETTGGGEIVSDALTTKEAGELRLLIAEDIRRYEQSIASLKREIASLEYYIAEAHTALADVDRREAGVAYPKAPAPKEGSAAPAQEGE